MKRKFDRVYQFKITLKGIKPPIWRRIQVPETYTFFDLHVAIQDVIGWGDYHLHEFEIINPITEKKVAIGIPEKENFKRSDSEMERIFSGNNNKDRVFPCSWRNNQLIHKSLQRLSRSVRG